MRRRPMWRTLAWRGREACCTMDRWAQATFGEVLARQGARSPSALATLASVGRRCLRHADHAAVL